MFASLFTTGSELTGVCSEANGYPGKTDKQKQKELENGSGNVSASEARN